MEQREYYFQMGKKHPPMVMKTSDVKKRMRLLREWEFICVICGHRFEDISSVTFEHLVPRAMGGKNHFENMAPSHHSCNELRGAKCLRKAARLVARKYRSMSNRDDEAGFYKWLNKKVPHRIIPSDVWVALTVPVCLEPPETLPGL